MLATMKQKRQVDTRWLVRAMNSRPKTPACRSGNVSVDTVVHDTGTREAVVDWRTAILSNQTPTFVRFDEDMTYRYLRDKNGTWMSDIPQEVYPVRDAIVAIRRLGCRRVLVGGLGLGVYSQLVLSMTKAEVVTVERDRNVIKLVGPHVRSDRHRIEQGCVYKFAENMPTAEFDYAILDTWRGTGETSWQTEVLPLRLAVRPKVLGVWCWKEDDMIGQFLQAIGRKLLLDARAQNSCDITYRTLRLAADAEGYPAGKTTKELFATGVDGLIEEGQKMYKRCKSLIRAFVRDMGSDAWVARFGEHYEKAKVMRGRRT